MGSTPKPTTRTNSLPWWWWLATYAAVFVLFTATAVVLITVGVNADVAIGAPAGFSVAALTVAHRQSTTEPTAVPGTPPATAVPSDEPATVPGIAMPEVPTTAVPGTSPSSAA